MDEFCKEKGFAAWFETSAKENINIEEAARALVEKVKDCNITCFYNRDVKLFADFSKRRFEQRPRARWRPIYASQRLEFTERQP